jgi:hypothetical protein
VIGSSAETAHAPLHVEIGKALSRPEPVIVLLIATRSL